MLIKTLKSAQNYRVWLRNSVVNRLANGAVRFPGILLLRNCIYNNPKTKTNPESSHTEPKP